MPFEIKDENVSLGADEEKKISDALEALSKDPHAPREISVKLTLHIHNEFPKIVYRGKESRSVANEAELEAAAKDGYGPYDHEAFTAQEE